MSDPSGKVACEACAKDNMVICEIDVRGVAKNVGFEVLFEGLRVDSLRDGKLPAAWGSIQILATRSPPVCWCLSACLPSRVCWPRSGEGL